MRLSLAVAPVVVAALALAGSARGGSLPMPNFPTDFAWGGPYVGLHFCGNVPCSVGTDYDNLTPFPGGLTADTFALSGLLAGVYGGFNWQQGQYVLGLDGEVDWTNLTGSQDFSVFGGLVAGTMKLSSDWQGSLKGRAGVLVTNALLLYGTAGVTAAHATVDVSGVDASGPGPFSASQSQLHLGGTLGLGAELALTHDILVRGEVDYTSFAAQTYNFGLAQFSPTSVRWDQVTGTIGLGVKF